MISALLPVRNAAATLPAALDSLLAQTYADLEILAVDDGSDDEASGKPGTRDVLRDYAARDMRVRFIPTRPQGIVAALRTALNHARGDHLARMDADDLSLPRRFELQAAHLDAHPETDLVACRVLFGGDPGAAAGYKRHVDWTNSLLSHDEISVNRFRESPLAHPSVMFRREAVRRFGFYRDGPFPEDYELWLRWLERGARMEKLAEPLLVWNDPPGRLSRTHPRYSVAAFQRIKAGYLARRLAAVNPFHPDVLVAGAGRVTRKRAEILCQHGVRITAWLDVDPRKIGKTVAGRPVLARADAPPPDRCFVVSQVASRGASEEIAAFLESRGFVAGKNYLLAA